MGRDDPDMQMLWSPMTQEGQARYATLRAAIRTAYAPLARKTPAQALRAKYAAATRRSGDEIFFEAFGRPDRLLRMDEDDEMCAELFQRSGDPVQPEPEPEPAPAAAVRAPSSSSFGFHPSTTTTLSMAHTHVSQLAKPTRLKTPARISLKRARAVEASAEKVQPLPRKPRLGLADTTNICNVATTTTTMTNPWDRHGLVKPTDAPGTTKPFGVSRFETTSFRPAAAHGSRSLLARPTAMEPLATTTLTSTRSFALR